MKLGTNIIPLRDILPQKARRACRLLRQTQLALFVTRSRNLDTLLYNFTRTKHKTNFFHDIYGVRVTHTDQLVMKHCSLLAANRGKSLKHGPFLAVDEQMIVINSVE